MTKDKLIEELKNKFWVDNGNEIEDMSSMEAIADFIIARDDNNNAKLKDELDRSKDAQYSYAQSTTILQRAIKEFLEEAGNE